MAESNKMEAILMLGLNTDGVGFISRMPHYWFRLTNLRFQSVAIYPNITHVTLIIVMRWEWNFNWIGKSLRDRSDL